MKRLAFVATLALPYLAFASIPPSVFWYEPGEVRIHDAPQGTAPAIEFFRDIKRPSIIGYSTVTRDSHNDVACEGSGGPFTYQESRGVLSGKDLVWWSDNDPRCGNLPVGSYWTETCWTVVSPARSLLPSALKDIFGWLLPPKRVCRTTLPFEIQ